MLVGVFDDADNVVELYTNGPQGKFATYVLNNDQNLHYLFKDQIGSERVAIQAPVGSTPKVSEWIQNHPFGGLAQRYGNYGTDFELWDKSRQP